MSEPIPAPDDLVLHEDRYFDPDPAVRQTARSLYDETRDLPIISPHGHVDPVILADDSPFPEPTALIVLPDHYVFRMLYSQGVPLERLGIPTCDGTPVERDPRKVWQLFSEQFHLFRGTPTAAWLSYELYHVFGVRKRLTGATAAVIYDEIREKLETAEFRPRALFERFNIEVLATTDAASDPLESHGRIRESGWQGRVIPTFRPDAAFRVAAPDWHAEIDRLSTLYGSSISDYATFIRVLESRRAFFGSLGATATDHDSEVPLTQRLPDEEADRLFQRARRGEATSADQQRFQAHMLMEMARCSTEDGLVMQLHAGALRDHNQPFLERFGPNTGADIPVATEYTRNLLNLLCAYGNDPRFRLILFTLDEATYSRELAPLAGHYPALRLGPPWWFHDSIEGMLRYRQRTTETAGIYNTAGFNDDTRAFCSIPARHDLARRVDATWLARLVARHIVDMQDARDMARALAYDLARDAYRFA
ncbi:MAG: glucuronate isomerase [Gemmatimonadota bacterium]|nr:MAG: glucuronate isomerase [Gemmatimonadota bacterium]